MESYVPTFAWKTINDLALFQSSGGYISKGRYGSTLFDRNLWPDDVYVTDYPLYRTVGLPESQLHSIRAGLPLVHEHMTSWTRSYALAESFTDSIWFKEFNDERKAWLIFKLDHTDISVFDVARAHCLPAFKSDVEYYRPQPKTFKLNLVYADSEQETVVNEGLVLTRHNIFKVIRRGNEAG